jgi:uncharacterized protein (DUF1778 family)
MMIAMARRLVNVAERPTTRKRVNISLTRGQWLEIRDSAAAAGRTFSRYVVEAALGRAEDDRKLGELVESFRRDRRGG